MRTLFTIGLGFPRSPAKVGTGASRGCSRILEIRLGARLLRATFFFFARYEILLNITCIELQDAASQTLLIELFFECFHLYRCIEFPRKSKEEIRIRCIPHATILHFPNAITALCASRKINSEIVSLFLTTVACDFDVALDLAILPRNDQRNPNIFFTKLIVLYSYRKRCNPEPS